MTFLSDPFGSKPFDLSDPQDQTNSQTVDLGYAANVDRSSILKDPRFLKDLQDRYDPLQQLSDEDLINKFYSDENWAQLNTVGAVGRMMEGGGDTDEEKMRNARLTAVWDNLPNFYQEGGRGWGAVPDIAKSVLLDPLNLIGGVAAKGVSQGAMRTSTALGRSAPVKSFLKGVTAGAATEGAISGGQEALINVSEQGYRQDIGLQQEFDWDQFVKATAFGTVLGGAVGGTIGIPSSIAGVRQGRADVEAGLFTGQAPEDIARLTNRQAGEMTTEAATRAGPYMPDEVERARAEQADATPETPVDDTPKTAEDIVIEEFKGQEEFFNKQIEQEEIALKDAERDLAKNPTDDNAKIQRDIIAKDLVQLKISRDIAKRIKLSQSDIQGFRNSSNSQAVQAKADGMQAKLDSDVAKARNAIDADDIASAQKILNDAKKRASEINKELKKVQATQKRASAKKGKGKGSATTRKAGRATGDESGPSSTDDSSVVEEGEDVAVNAEAEDSEASRVAELRETNPKEYKKVMEADLRDQVLAGKDKETQEELLAEWKDISDPNDVDAFMDRSLETARASDNKEKPVIPYAQRWGNKDDAKKEADNAFAKYNIPEDDAERILDDLINSGKINTKKSGVIHGNGAPRAIKEHLKEMDTTSPDGSKKKSIQEDIRDLASDQHMVKIGTQDYQEAILETAKRKRSFDSPEDIEANLNEMVAGGRAASDEADRLIMQLDVSKFSAKGKRAYREAKLKVVKLENEYKNGLTESELEDYVPITDDEIELNARKMVLKSNPQKNSPRNVNKAIENASILIGAGRTENGKIQSFIKWDTGTVGLGRNETRHFNKGTNFDYEGARTEVITNKERQNRKLNKLYQRRDNTRNEENLAKIQAEIDELEALPIYAKWKTVKTETAIYFDKNGNRREGKFPANSVLWTDGKTGRKYDSEFTARKIANDGIKKTKGSVDASATLNPPKQGDSFVMFIKHKNAEEGTGGARPYRLLSLKQADKLEQEGGNALDALLGRQKDKKADWEVRYVDADKLTPKTRRNLPSLWDEADERPNSGDGIGVIRSHGNAKASLTATPMEKPNMLDTDLDVSKLTEQQRLAFNRQNKQRANLGPPNLADVQYAIEQIHNGAITPNGSKQDLAQLVNDLGQLYSIQADVMPAGYVESAAKRIEILEDIDNIMSGADPNTVRAVRQTLEALDGDPSRAPNIIRSEGGDGWSYGDGQITMDVTSRSPADHQFFHAIAQWSYDNILTPEDKMVFWQSLVSGIAAKGKVKGAKIPLLERYADATGNIPRKIFADQFSSWVFDNRSAGIFKGTGKQYLNEMKDIQVSAINRYFSGREIPSIHQNLFAKILPEEVRHRFKHNDVKEPGYEAKTPTGKHAQAHAIIHKMEFERMQKAVEDFEANENPEVVTMAATELLRHLKTVFRGKGIGGSISYARGLDKIARGRIADIEFILRGGAEGETGKRAIGGVRIQDGLQEMKSVDNLFQQAELLSKLYKHGHVGVDEAMPEGFKGGDLREYYGDKPEFTSLKKLDEMLLGKHNDEFFDKEGKWNEQVVTNYQTGKEDLSSATKISNAKLVVEKRKKKTLVNNAKNVTTTPKSKRKYKKVDDVPSDIQMTYGAKTYEDLIEDFRKHDGTPTGDHIAWLMYQKQNTAKVPIEKELSKEQTAVFKKMTKVNLMEMFQEGIRTGRYIHPETKVEFPLADVEWEIQRRGLKPSKKKATHVRQRIKTEVTQGVGVPTEDGIPASAPISTKTILSYMSHRDPEVQYTMRTMLYRMMNLMGKNVEDTLGDTNVMDASDIALLAQVNPAGMKNVAVDFRHEAFNKLRSNLRKMSIGLTKGNSDPFDAVHEVGHTMVRAGMLPTEEMDAVVELFRASKDDIKSRVNASYGKKYSDEQYTSGEKERLLAEEWFAEGLAKYMGGRVMRGDVAKAMSGANMSNIRLKNSFEKAIDRIVEYVSYAVNGLIGRKDIKQQFRRLMIYGDMLEATNGNPFSTLLRKKEAGVPSQYAGMYASDVLRYSTPSKKAAINKYTGNGKYSLDEEGNPITYYHGTPNGVPFEDSQVVMERGGGWLGRGIYITPDARASEGAYAKRPTPRALTKMIKDLEVTEDMRKSVWPPASSDEQLKGEMERLAYEVYEARDEIARSRRKLADVDRLVEDYNKNVDYLNIDDASTWDPRTGDFAPLDDETKAMLHLERKNVFDEQQGLTHSINNLLGLEEIKMKALADMGLNIKPTVLPLYSRMLNTFETKGHRMGEPHTEAAINGIIAVTKGFADGHPLAFRRALMTSFASGGRTKQGMHSYNAFIDAIMQGDPTLGKQEAQDIFTEALQNAGYDSIRAPHSNRMNVDPVLAPDGDGFNKGHTTGEQIEYEAFIVFDPEQVKHINAEFFDAEDPRLHYRDFNNSGRGFNGGATVAMADGSLDKLETSNTVDLLTAVEDEGTSPPLVDAMSSLVRQRDFTPVQEQAVRKQGPMAWLQAQSVRMENMGMNWLGGWYKQHFPDQHQTFASKYMPLHHILRGLPGADGKIRAWARSASGGLGQKQPEAYTKIVSALRHGPDSRQEKRLTKSEKFAADQIRKEFSRERARMIDAGMNVGYRRNYVPQIWSRTEIQKNRSEFIEGMIDYYKQEQTRLSNTVQEADARQFAEKVYQSLTRESIDGVQVPESPKSPVRGSTKNAQAESLDFNRLIELEKYPRAMKNMEKFLENDLEFMLVKYFEGSSRRMLHTKKFGLNSHGVDDYLFAVENGSRGIARLLSSNKVYQKDFRSVTTDGVEEGVLRAETVMPFTGREQEATKFAEDLVETAKKFGSPAVREKLLQIEVKNPNRTKDPTYHARVDAIVGALEDYKGVKTLLENDDARFIENSMRIARKDSLNDFGGKAGLRASRFLRSVNNVTLLGFTTLTSLGDVALPIIRSGEVKDWIKTVYSLATDKEYRRALSEVGIAMENITHERMLNMYGAVDNKLSNAFFNATMLTPWTDMNRNIAGALGYQTFITNQRRALNSYVKGKPISEQPRDYKIAYRYMKDFGLENYLEGGTNSRISLSDRSLLKKDANLRKAMIRFADESIFQPNANDSPMFSQTPLGALVFQLKSFPTMMSRLAYKVVADAKLHKLFKGDASESNIKPLLYFAALGPSFGMGALAVKDIVQMRGGEDEQSPELRVRNAMKTLGYDEKIHGNEVDFWGWYMEGVLQMGGVGLLGDIIHAAVTQADNGSYGQTRFLQTLGGPSVGLVTAGLSAFAGGKDYVFGSTESNAKERTAAREIVSRIPVVGGVKKARESLVDAWAGEATGKQSSGWGGWGGSWS